MPYEVAVNGFRLFVNNVRIGGYYDSTAEVLTAVSRLDFAAGESFGIGDCKWSDNAFGGKDCVIGTHRG